jgi:nanoRNase/pAp phosphatase (c-di-AMP/oligoRNAs hydrolase)
MHNLAKLCEQYGGGGHAVVAAISFRPDDLDNARAAAREIAQKLQADLKARS